MASRLTLPKSFSGGPKSRVVRDAWVAEEVRRDALLTKEF